MNKYIFCGLLAGLGLLVSACGDKLEIQPTQSIDQSIALSTEQDVRVTLVGAYDGISDVDVYGGGIQFTNEFVGDDREVVFGGTFGTLDELWRKTITPGNLQVRDTWLGSYDAINRTNNVLSALDRVGEDSRNQIEGEARFIRGLTYFGLIRLFAKSWGNGDNNTNLGVPLVLTPTRTLSEADNRPRNTVAEVYAQILEDLTRAAELLPAPASNENPGFATSSGARALLARLYLIQDNFAAARDAANQVIEAKGPLRVSFADAFNDASSQPEILFKIIVTDQDGSNAMNTYYGSVPNQGRGDVRVQTKHIDLYDSPTDERAQFFNLTNNGARRFTNKFSDRFGDVPVIRLAEMYLIRAEANFRLGTAVGTTPLEDINAVRTRANATPLTPATLSLATILRERRLELAFEGVLLDDLKRTQGSVTIAGEVSPSTDNRLVLPIPQREIDTNPALKGQQNPGY
jgi:starch-binding outer membrane protein, SusD/RagB family